MSGFIYNGKSTDTIIDSSKLVLATFNEVTEIFGHERENVVGETSITRSNANEYGTRYTLPMHEYCLMKEDGTVFTENEQEAVETWLSSPKFSSALQLFNCNGSNGNIYEGKFIYTDWVVSAGGFIAVNFRFQCSKPYSYIVHAHSYTATSGGISVTIDCGSDELEEYVYPVVTIYAPNSTNNVTITNRSDDSNSLTIRALHRLNITLDSEHCMLYDVTQSSVIDFDDVGWEDVGNIYWLRLLPTENILRIEGDAQVTITYKSVSKKVVDWL